MIFFDSVLYNEKEFTNSSKGSLFSALHFYQQEIHRINDFEVGVVGLEENSLNIFRENFYKLGDHFQYPILDLGLLQWSNEQELNHKIKILSKDITLIVVGGPMLDCGIKQAIVTNEFNNELSNKHNIIGYQRHRTAVTDFINMSEYDHLSLGEVRRNMLGVEPILRDCNGSNIDLAVIKKSDSNLDLVNNTCGLTLEETCQISRYLGISSGMNFLQLHNFEHYAKGENINSAAECASIISWYFLEGVLNKIYESPDKSNNITYLINNELFEDPITFIKSNISGRWWIKVGDENAEAQPCLFEDYISCRSGNVPDRLLSLINQ